MNFNKECMYLALREASRGLEKEEIPVGAVIVGPDGSVISSSYNEVESLNDVTAHAEILAIKKASLILNSKFLNKCDIYITLEPCLMCLAAISFAKISRVFYGASNAKYGAITNNIQIFSTSQAYYTPQIYSDILKDESEILLRHFFKD
jgi:tRNA(Arg) A34 adenosine deaminase TadA